MTGRLLLYLLPLLVSSLGAVGQVVGPYRVPTTPIDIAEFKSASDNNLNGQMLNGRNRWHGHHDDKPPVFKGGNDSLVAFLQRNVQWPDSLPYSIKGKVHVRFTIDERGEIRSPRIVQSLHPLADAEALRLAGLLSGRFTPGSRDGRFFPVETTLPVTFSGSDAESGELNK